MIQNTQLQKLQEKRTEIENNYNKAKEHRIEIVNSINELDKQLEEIDEIIEQSKENFKDTHFNKLKIKHFLKSYLGITLSQWGIALLIASIINLFVLGKFGVAPIGVISSGLVISLLNAIQYTKKIATKKEQKVKKIKKVRFQDLEKIEKERTILIEQRVSKGAEYKRAREEELLREKIYKQLDPILAVEMIRILEDNHVKRNKKDINTKDIYYKIKLDYSFDRETIENKKIILDNELKKYLSSKISEIYQNVINFKDLSFLTTEELVRMLLQEIPQENHKDILINIIHAIINFSGNLQGYGVVWYEEKDLELIENPIVTFDEYGKWTEYKTHQNTNYYKAFQIVYNTFINDVMNNKKMKNRTKSNY